MMPWRHNTCVCSAMTSWSWHRSLAVKICILCALIMDLVESISLAPVYWNMSNPIFKSSRNDHVIEVQLYDDIDVICPFYPATIATDNAHFEYYVIYRVKRADYDNCIVDIDDGAQMVLNCSEPRQRRRFTILFEPYQSIPNVPEYHPGRSYHFITTSSGDLQGLSDTHQGACVNRNMRLAVQVCCQTPVIHALAGIFADDKHLKEEELSNSVEAKTKLTVNSSSLYRSSPTSESINRQPEMTSSTTSSSYHVITVSRSIGRRNKWAPIPTARVKSLAKSGALNTSMDGAANRDIDDLRDQTMMELRHSSMLFVSSASAGGAYLTMTSLMVVTGSWFWWLRGKL